jgi:hypothetical protein
MAFELAFSFFLVDLVIKSGEKIDMTMAGCIKAAIAKAL